MNPHDFELMVIMFGTLGMIGGALLGLRMFLTYRVRRFEASRGGGPQLEDAVQQLRDEVYLLRNDVAEVHERLDFAERLLTRGAQAPNRAPEP